MSKIGEFIKNYWRPSAMMVFIFLIFFYYFIGPIFNIKLPQLPTEFWDLMKICFGAYVVGRSVDKTFGKNNTNDTPNI